MLKTMVALIALSAAGALAETCFDRAGDASQPVSAAGCPGYGRHFIRTVATAIGNYELYVFRGTSVLDGNGSCTAGQPFTPFLPTDVMFAANNDLYISGEFMHSFIRLPAADYTCAGQCAHHRYKQEICIGQPDEKPFTLALSTIRPRPMQSNISGWSVGGTTTPDGKIWISQPGGYNISGSPGMASKWSMVSAAGINIPVQTAQNRGRLVAYTPSTGAQSIFNMPGPWPNILSPTWDNQRQRLWFLDAGWDFNNPRVGSFKPGQLDRSPGHESPQTSEDLQQLSNLECKPGQPTDNCYQFYDLPTSHDNPGLVWPIFIALDPGGRVWVAGGLSNNLARLTPETGAVDIIPLDDTVPNPALLGHSPFYMEVDSAGFLWVGSYFYGRIFRIDTNRTSMAGCTALDSTHRNPCLDVFDIPAAYAAQFPPYPHSSDYGIEGISFDHQENLWFGRGFIKASDLSIHFIEPLQEPGDTIYKIFGQRPFANKSNGDVWFTDYFSRKIYWLNKVP